MGAGQDRITVTGLSEEWAARIQAIAATALDQLGDVGPRVAVTVCVDGETAEEVTWYGRQEAGNGSPVLVLYCSREDFLAPVPLTLTIASEVWERQPLPHSQDPDPGRPFDPDAAARFLYHHLVFAADLYGPGVNFGAIPMGLHEAFQAAWAVTVDGRLARFGLPGYPLYYRRRCFSRLFAGAGILLPAHWRIFQGLWDGECSTQNSMVAAIRGLPRLSAHSG